MTSSILFSEQPLIHALGWSLLHFLWEGVIVAVILASGLQLLSGRSPQIRYMVACCALALMLVLPLATFGYLAITSHAADHTITSSIVETSPVLSIREGLNGAAETLLDRTTAFFDRSLPWVLTAWFAGVILLLGRLNIGLMVARRMKSVAIQAAPVELEMVFHNLKHRLRIGRPVRLANSALVQVPTVIGWLRPAVLIPMGCLAGLSPIQIEAIFAHELAHIRRHDYLVSVLQSFVEAVLFYHPAVWWVSKQARKEREDCCDDLAVRTSGDSLAYAKALSLLEEHRSSLPVVGVAANGGALGMRIRRLLGYKQAPAFSRLAGMTLLAVAVAAAALCIGTLARAQTDAGKQLQTESGRGSQSLPPQYRKWLDEDVVWIITPQERAAFMKLPTNGERDEFIRQFWKRRNVETPGGGETNFKQKYYHRIAYANQHFAAGMPGWKTDRGRIYILYGPPDSIDSHPTGSGATKPYEVWHYRMIQEARSEPVRGTQDYKATLVTRKDVDMKFVDPCSCGKYQLQTFPKG